MSEDHTHGVCEKHGPWTKNGRCFECMAEAFGSKPPYDESAARIATLEASLALISDAMIRGSKRWRDAHPNSNIVIPDLANLVEWLLEQIQIRDGKIATLEAELQREAERRAEVDAKLDAALSELASERVGNRRHEANAEDYAANVKRLQAERDTARAQLATLSRCAREHVDAFGEFAIRMDRLMKDPYCKVTAAEEQNTADMSRRVTETLRAMLAALDSGGGEGESGR